MFSLNRVQLIGYVTQPVALRQTPGGQSVADLNVATPYTFETDAGQTLSGTGYHSVTVWGGMANTAAQYIKAGSQVFLNCRLQTDSWEDQQTGEKRSRTRFVALDLILLDPREGQLTADASMKSLTHCLNRADVIGNLTRDPEARTTAGGQSLATFGVATNERWRDRSTNEQKERAEFHNIVVWGGLAATCTAHLKKGRRVYVSGRVQTRSWETQAGGKRTTTEIVADRVSLLGVKNTDIAYQTEPRMAPSRATGDEEGSDPARSRLGGQPETSAEGEGLAPSGIEGEPPAPQAGVMDIPDVKYESDVKVEDLPF